MTRRRTNQDDEPATVPAVAVNPLTETDAETWQRWSQDRHQRKLQKRAEIQASNDAQATAPIYPREFAQAIAKDAAHTVLPDWRLLRTEYGGLLKRLIAQQPDWRPREVQQFGPLVRLIADNLPPHIRPLVQDLEAITELRAVAREAAAFFIGMETGRRLEYQHIDPEGRLRESRRPRVTRRKAATTNDTTEPEARRLRLTLAE
jgi:hypothetical protein